MAIDPEVEPTKTFAKAIRDWPDLFDENPPHPATLARWWKDGRSGIHLETLKQGSKRVTSRKALKHFFQAVTAATEPTGQPSQTAKPIRTAELTRRMQNARRRVEAQG